METKEAVKICDATGERLPDDLAGFQNVVCGQVNKGDLLIRPDGMWEWAHMCVGDPIEANGTTGSRTIYRVYRKIPCPKAGDLDPSWKKIQAEVATPQVTPQAKALTHDDGKPPLANLPWASLDLMAQVQAYGHKKYGDFNNYRKGMEASRQVSCVMRHLRDFMNGVDKDHESGLHPLGHAMTRLGFIIQNLADGVLVDDRYKKPSAA